MKSNKSNKMDDICFRIIRPATLLAVLLASRYFAHSFFVLNDVSVLQNLFSNSIFVPPLIAIVSVPVAMFAFILLILEIGSYVLIPIEKCLDKRIEKHLKNTVYIDEEINSYENDTATFD